MEHKVLKLQEAQEEMNHLIKQLQSCTDSKMSRKIEAKLIRIINRNVKLVHSK